MAKAAVEAAKSGTPAAQLFGGCAHRMNQPRFFPLGDSVLVVSPSPADILGQERSHWHGCKQQIAL